MTAVDTGWINDEKPMGQARPLSAITKIYDKKLSIYNNW
jgi:hypothetical protein